MGGGGVVEGDERQHAVAAHFLTSVTEARVKVRAGARVGMKAKVS